MPVDRSISGIRVSGGAEKRRPTTRFPVGVPSKVAPRRSSPTVDGSSMRSSSTNLGTATGTAAAATGLPAIETKQPHRHRAAMPPSEPRMTSPPPVAPHSHARRTRQVGRVRPWFVTASPGSTPGADQRESVNRKPVRSLTIALLLAAATAAGVGMAAWATGDTPTPGGGVLVESGSTNNSTVSDKQGTVGSPATAAALEPTIGTARPTATAATRSATTAAALPGGTDPAPPPALSHGPALVSTLAPGAPGFGWPASAFGSGPP